MSDAENEIFQLLSERHRIPPGQPADFQVQNMTEVANVLGIITGTMTALLASIAGISLLVGGVGIMNVMLVSVTERTREIGIRMAVGARSRDILQQFLVESVILSCFGGIVGLALGVGSSIGVMSTSSWESTVQRRSPLRTWEPAAPPTYSSHFPPSIATAPTSLTVASAQFRGHPDTPSFTLCGNSIPWNFFSMPTKIIIF